jgi:hypothetical protein
MDQPLFVYAGNASRIVATKVVALYDPESGRIRHTHTVHIHAGGRHVSDDEAMEGARRHAKQLGHDIDRLKATMSSHAAHGHVPHRIDLASGDFVAIVLSESVRRTADRDRQS